MPQAIEENLIKIVQKNHLEHLENKLEIIEELINEDQIQYHLKKTNHKTNRKSKIINEASGRSFSFLGG